MLMIPLDLPGLRRWATDGVRLGETRGYTVTPAMLEAFGLQPGEEAEYTALCIASVASLLRSPRRVVLVAEVEARPLVGDEEFGAAVAQDLAWGRVTSLFVDDPAETGRMAELHAVLRTADLAVAWDDPQVESLLAETDLLWHAAEEWGTLERTVT